MFYKMFLKVWEEREREYRTSTTCITGLICGNRDDIKKDNGVESVKARVWWGQIHADSLFTKYTPLKLFLVYP